MTPKITSHVRIVLSIVRFSVFAFWNRHLETGSQTRMETLENERWLNRRVPLVRVQSRGDSRALTARSIPLEASRYKRP